MANQEDILQQLKGNAGDIGTPTYVYLTLASLTSIKVGAGSTNSITFGHSSNPTLSLWDNASGASNTAIFIFGAGVPAGSYVLDRNFSNGLTAYFGLGNVPSVSIRYR